MRCVVALVLVLQGCALSPAADAPAPETVDIAAVLTRAEGLFQAREYDRARAELLSAYNAGLRETALLKALAETELMLGFASDAAFRTAIAAEASPSDPRALFWAAVAAREAGRGEEAAGYLEKALAAAGEDEIELFDLAEHFLRRGLPSVAAAVYEKILAIYPRESQFDIFSSLHLSSYYQLTGRNDRAAEVMAKARHAIEYGDINIMAPQEVDYWTALLEGLAAIDRGETQKGLSLLRDAAANFPIALAADGSLVACLDRAGRTDEAAAVYALVAKRLKSRIAEQPESGRAYHDFAFFAAIAGRGADTGLKYCEWALNIEPLRPEYLNTKAALLLALGRYDEALKSQERAIVLITSTRWAEPGLFLHAVWQRLDILEKTGRIVPSAFRRVGPAPAD